MVIIHLDVIRAYEWSEYIDPICTDWIILQNVLNSGSPPSYLQAYVLVEFQRVIHLGRIAIAEEGCPR